MLSQIMSQSLRNTTVPPRPGRVTGPARAGLKAAPVSAPHEDAEDQGQADRDRREMGGAAGNRGARLLGPKDGAPRSRGGDGLDETIGQSLFHDLPLTAHIARDPGISRVPLGSQDSPVSGERLRKATNDCLLYHQLLEDVLRKVAIDYECRRTLSLTSPRREASLFKLGRSLWFRPFSFLPFPAASDACQRQTRRGHPRPAA
jgi:hypothetical protein